MEPWDWMLFAALGMLAAYQQLRIYWIRRQAEKREELFKIVTENAADMIALVDVKGRRLYNSPAYKRVLGYSPAELSETSAFEQIHPDDRLKVLTAAREARESGVGQKLEYRIRHKNGSWRVLESAASTIRDAKGEVARLVIVNRDITERKRAEERLEHNSFHDALTGLPNRRLFLDRLQRLFARSQRSPESRYAVLFVDVDGFKAINETLGPAAGDQVIVEIGRRLSACLRTDDTVARSDDKAPLGEALLSRLGGDEFTILLDSIGDPSDAMRVARRIQAAVAEPLLLEKKEVRTSASVGIALSTTAQERADDLLQDAEAAARRAKALGGARCEVFDEGMHERAVSRLELEEDLRTAIVERQFRVHYQPIVDLNSQQVTGFEALLRWRHPEQGIISPYKFLDAAEDTGLLVAIGHWLLSESCRQLGMWLTRYPTRAPLCMTVNLSARQFADPRLIEDVRAAVQANAIPPRQLQLEMTERVAMADPKLTSTVCAQLRRLGVGIILDDFGTGQSSLCRLRQFPVEAVKIDRVLVGEMLADRGTCDIVELIITLAHKLSLKVIAEGIETAAHRDRLRKLGCQFGQGYLFAQALDAEAADRLLQDAGSQPQANGAAAK